MAGRRCLSSPTSSSTALAASSGRIPSTTASSSPCAAASPPAARRRTGPRLSCTSGLLLRDILKPRHSAIGQYKFWQIDKGGGRIRPCRADIQIRVRITAHRRVSNLILNIPDSLSTNEEGYYLLRQDSMGSSL